MVFVATGFWKLFAGMQCIHMHARIIIEKMRYICIKHVALSRNEIRTSTMFLHNQGLRLENQYAR